jgi:hypothetical protein
MEEGSKIEKAAPIEEVSKKGQARLNQAPESVGGPPFKAFGKKEDRALGLGALSSFFPRFPDKLLAGL